MQYRAGTVEVVLPAEHPDSVRSLLRQVANSGRAALFNATWEWTELTTPAERVIVHAPERYWLRFERDGKIAVKVDCNRGMGSYSLAGGDGIAFGPIALTRMGCPPESLEGRFVDALSRAASYSVRDGELFLELSADGGTLRFRRGG
jgi:para-nitrobenzyl esterase